MKKVDAVIIGSGQAGTPLAEKLASSGWKTVLVEISEASLGGTCLNFGCTPTKTLIASAKVMHTINVSKKHGISVSDVKVNFKKTQKRKDAILKDGKDGLKKRLSEISNLELIYGAASFTGKDSIVIKNKGKADVEISAANIFINVGTRPAVPEIEGLEKIKWYDSTAILDLDEIPEKLIVLGGGYIGMELGQMFSRFGSKVTIIEKSDQIMSSEDIDVANSIQEILSAEGMSFELNATVESVKDSKGNVEVTFLRDNKKHKITGSRLLVVTGRTSNADYLNTEAAGIKLDEKDYVIVDKKLRTNITGIYALGDINGGPQFTHIAYNDYVIVSNNLLNNGNESTKGRIVPYTMFTDPQIGRVGLSENQAREQGYDYEIITIEGERITRGIETAQPQGLWKAVVDKKTGMILGASIICSEGGEIATVIQMAMGGKIPAKKLGKWIFAHPTFSESLNTLFGKLKEDQ